MKISVFHHHILEAAKQEGISEHEIFSRIKAAGITAVELDRDGIEDVDRLNQMLSEFDFSISSIYGFYDFTKDMQLELCQKHLQLAKALNADKIMIIPGFYNNSEEAGQIDELEKMIEGTKYLCQLAHDNGIISTIEDFDSITSPLCSVKGMKRFLDAIPSLFVTLDTGNFVIRHEDEMAAFSALQNKIVHVHCKDRSYDENKLLLPSPVGYGFIDMAGIIKELKKNNYHGFLTIEHFGADNYLDFMLKSVAWLKEEGCPLIS